MAILIDGAPISDAALTQDATVGHAVDLAKAHLAGTGRLILGIVCDGEELTADRVGPTLRTRYHGHRQIDFLSGSPHGAVLDVLAEARTHFSESFATVQRVSAALTAGDIPGAMAGLGECVAAWSHLHEAIVHGGALVGIDFDRLVIGGRHVLDWLGDFSRQLRQIRDAVQARDHVALADIVKYELDESLQAWETMLDGFIRYVENQGRQADA